MSADGDENHRLLRHQSEAARPARFANVLGSDGPPALRARPSVERRCNSSCRPSRIIIDTDAGRTEYLHPGRCRPRTSWSAGRRCSRHLKNLPGLLDVSLNNRLQRPVGVVVNRDLAARMGVDLQAIDDTLYDSLRGPPRRRDLSPMPTILRLLEVARSYQADSRSLHLIRVASGRQADAALDLRLVRKLDRADHGHPYAASSPRKA
jgi:hypothetical protein